MYMFSNTLGFLPPPASSRSLSPFPHPRWRYVDRSVGAIAMVQDRTHDLPYVSWSLTPIYEPDPLAEVVEGIEGGRGVEDHHGMSAGWMPTGINGRQTNQMARR